MAAWLLAAALLALLAGGCGAANSTTVTISGNQLDRQTLNVSAGTTVTWVNEDQTANTVTSDGVNTDTSLLTKAGPGKFNSGPLNPGQSFSFTFSTPGTYQYSSIVHGYIIGTVIVK
jgi:Plastocyanin